MNTYHGTSATDTLQRETSSTTDGIGTTTTTATTAAVTIVTTKTGAAMTADHPRAITDAIGGTEDATGSAVIAVTGHIVPLLLPWWVPTLFSSQIDNF